MTMTILPTPLRRGYTYPRISGPSLRDISMDFGAHLPQSSRYYTLSLIRNGLWVVSSGYYRWDPASTATTDTRREAVKYIRRTVARAKDRLGREAVAKQWEAICEASAAQAKLLRDAADCLRDETIRGLLYAAIRLGRSWTSELDYFASRRVQRDALRCLRDRMARRRDRATSQAARVAAPSPDGLGRIQRLHRDRVAAREANSIAKRDARITSALRAAYRACDFRRAGAGDHTLRLSVGDRPGAYSDTTRGERYSSRCTWRKNDSLHSIAVCPDWINTVERNGFAVVDGCLVIHARRVGTGVWAVRYVRQGRGFRLEVETGVIVRHGGQIGMGKTEEHARRKCVAEFVPVLSR